MAKLTTSDNVFKESASQAGFDYCFWSKLLVAIVLFPLVAFIVAHFFANLIVKILAVVLAIAGIMYTAYVIDHIPCLTGKIPPLIGKKPTQLTKKR